jgi:hypothetical protein
MRRQRNIPERLLVRRGGKAELQQPDRFPAIGHRCLQASSAVAIPTIDLDRLAGQRAALRSTDQRHALGGLAALSACGRCAGAMVEPDQRLPAEVRDQEGDVKRTDGFPQALAEDLDGSDRRRILDGGKQLRQVQPPRSVIRHEPHPT